MKKILKVLLGVVVAASVAVILATIVAMLGGWEYLKSFWESHRFIGFVIGWRIVVAILGFAFLALYFVPTVIAFLSNHHNVLAILALNTLLGWTFIGWVAALVWSLTKPAPSPAPSASPPTAPKGGIRSFTKVILIVGILIVGGVFVAFLIF